MPGLDWNSELDAAGDIKLAQVRVLATKLAELAEQYDAAVIMACDFNSTPDSAIYQFCSAGELALSRIDRRTMSGQLAEPVSPGSLVRRSSARSVLHSRYMGSACSMQTSRAPA